MKEDNLIEINTNSNFPLLKEDSSSLNHSFSINEEPNYKLNNIIQNFSEFYFYATLNPDFVDNNIIYFFFPDEFIIELETMLNDSLNNYPITFRPIKDELIQFSKEKQENEFKKKIGFFPALSRKISLITSSEKNSKNERIKAKKIAYLLSQLNSQKKANNNIIYIVYLNKNDSKCNFDYNIFFDEIYNNFSLDIFKNDDSKNIDDIFSKIKRFEDILINNPNIKEKDKKIFINYMILIINKKIIEIEHSYQLELLNDESKKTLKKIRNSIDLLALKYRFQFTHNVKFFYDIEFELIKIIKNNKEEKKAFIEKGNNLEIFKNSFQKEFKNIKNITEPIDENENIKDFNKKCWKSIDTLNNKKTLIVYEENNSNSDKKVSKLNILDSINSIIGKNPQDLKIKRFDVKDIDEQKSYWEKLRNIDMLLKEIDKIERENKNFIGLFVSQKKNNNFSVDIIYNFTNK